MKSSYFDDETVMAFADGETDAETTARIEAALETDDELMARVATFMETRAAAKEALAPMLNEPVPDALMASVRRMIDERDKELPASATPDASTTPDNVITFAPRPAPTPAPAPGKRLWLASLAASILVAVVAGSAGYFAGQSAIPQGPDFTHVTPAVAGILEKSASASDVAAIDVGSMRVVSSFRSEAGEFCREFEVSLRSGRSVTSVACHTAGNWETRLTVATEPHDIGYVPAGAQETVDTYLSSIGAAGALSPTEEAQALKALQESRK
ncbi:hypothetical protein OIU34_35640 [Pararhizobium sp. BT-229]|uniref:anti-sigma factor family protein n=1 Tax=Pararhizobium sp. BT-229 TaxID=2986923 RepID=UPI0021F6C6E1|nr:hypothetical protein [Pararhizobium sp. BT-229]MCV9967168.1 hypothetical protein [Pararhizobium sp. BT-229]